jgi:hypothetical protein
LIFLRRGHRVVILRHARRLPSMTLDGVLFGKRLAIVHQAVTSSERPQRSRSHLIGSWSIFGQRQNGYAVPRPDVVQQEIAVRMEILLPSTAEKQRNDDTHFVEVGVSDKKVGSRCSIFFTARVAYFNSLIAFRAKVKSATSEIEISRDTFSVSFELAINSCIASSEIRPLSENNLTVSS